MARPDLRTAFVSDPNTGQAIRTGDIIPEPAIDPASGQLYVVWQDSRFTGGHFDEVALSTSTNGGASWSAPIQVNTNTPSNRPGFTPMIHVSSDGTVGVSFYDFRNLTTETATLPTDYWFVSSMTHGASFGNEVHLAGPFDMLTAPSRAASSSATTKGSTPAPRASSPSSCKPTPATARTARTCSRRRSPRNTKYERGRLPTRGRPRA